MPKQEEPLNEVSLNTPAGKSNALMCQSKLKYNKENAVSTIDVYESLDQISSLLKDKRSTVRQKMEISDQFSSLYKLAKKGHMINVWKTLSKHHLMFVVKLFNCDDSKAAQEEILHLYNETNPFQVVNLHQILLSDFNFCNVAYLSTLKILAMQAILKLKSCNDYEQTLLQVFSHDERYLLRDTNLKMHTVVKLLLNFYSISPSYRVIFGLKFVQYVNQYNLKMGDYIKNMDILSFERQLLRYVPKQNITTYKLYLNSIYMQYTKHRRTPEKVMLSDILPSNEQNPSKDILQLIDTKDEQQKLLAFKTEDLIRITNESLKHLEVGKVLGLLRKVWFILRHDFSRDNRHTATFSDKTLIFINTKLSEFHEGENDIMALLETLYEYCIDNQEQQRLNNIINTMFNCSVVLKDYGFLKSAARMEVSKYYIFKDTKSIRPMLKKFEKFISCSSVSKQASEIFALIFNVHLTLNEPSFTSLQNFCQTTFGSVFAKLKLRSYVSFPNCSEVMLALLYSNASNIHVPLESWSPTTQMLYSCLSGVLNLNTTDIINSSCSREHMLQRYEVLIKTAYCFNVEMSKHSSMNLVLITKRYMDKWVSRIVSSVDTISPFEMEMLKMLLQYLKFNNLDKTLIDLTDLLSSKEDFYECISTDIEFYRCSALIDLKMSNDLKLMKDCILNSTCNFTLKLEPLLNVLHLRLKLFLWEDDQFGFQKLFIHELPLMRPELLDVDNNTKMPASKYVKILLFNIDLLGAASRLHISSGRMLEAVIEAKKALKLSVCLLKKIDKISQRSRLKLILSLAFAYMNLIKAYIHIGVSRDCEYYIKEFSKVICDLGEPNVVFLSLHFLYQYYLLTEQTDLATTVLKKGNKTFNFIDGESNIWGLTLFLYDNEEKEKVGDCLRIFFGDELPKTFLLRYWELKMGYVVNSFECPQKYRGQNNINKVNSMYRQVMQQLESDPFFKSMFDSLIAAPSCQRSQNEANSIIQTPSKHHLKSNVNASPRSSSMTPRGKHMRQKFDRAAAINNLETLKKFIEEIELEPLKNHELSQLASFYSLTLSLLSCICPQKVTERNLTDRLVLSDLSKCLPLFYDNVFSEINHEIYSDFHVLPMNEVPVPVSTEKEKLLHLQESFRKCSQSFNVISIDVCPANENLLINKLESKSGRMIHLRVPLDRTYTRDLDSHRMTFYEARNELISIVQESNATTSAEVTSAIKTREERRMWWETRYDLDRRLELLITNMEHYWFNGLKGIFCPEVINTELLEEFKARVNEILHQNLPSRKQFGNPSMFTQIDNWIIGLMLKLHPQDDHFNFMIEDILYFILDILLFQGEENAYDEIDFGVIHIQLEEQIRKFRARLREGEKVSHTFLVIGNECHMFPWEKLSFMNSLSVSRVPSFGYLNDVLQKFDYNLFPEVSLGGKISMVLNPHGDLSRTETRFSYQFSKIAQEKKESKLLVNSKPEESIFLQMLISSNVFVYLGHGGGEQYARLKEIKRCNSIAPSFLLGCSSAAMKYFKNLEPTGTAYAYLVGGCPLVLGNLWDVTDKDIDKFSEAVFDKINFFEEQNNSSDGRNLSLAVSSSRDVCHLKYLNGAAPVVYGLPMKFF
ncbi:hypothetical protein ZYGR_0I05360 [Zygosaccharomyces rouxii]|uniref:separase n=2 Tax=Zygosaccharomyces rouxii TaxID=4956 RepID=C5DU01_ZYGRC|nr:uncharacterized protein ZYRO0C12672g [Zygosaccharomyces rouxii]KAH9201562.1 peptidase family C50-domain-containing protein [Zygosaccharomyces rouxii]GAV48239.1 hypothetical protein ZYGR_0I05360 [Zygosaccharomyces rouxii]CAR27262.1 ZYRO0C12672p [Zygosaccharomyces rouxii]